jgi:LysM repeat protein
MKKSIFLAILSLCFSAVFAQQQLLVQNGDKGLYLNHTITSGENFFSVGRIYNVSAKDIAVYNGLEMNNGLSIGQTLKIPLSEHNFSQEKNEGVPVYYSVGQSEGLYRVSVKNKNVLMANIRKWNALKNDNIQTGQKLIIGYLVSPGADKLPATESHELQKPTEKPEIKDVVEESPERIKTADPNTAIVKAEQEPQPEKVLPKQEAVKQVAVNDGKGGFFKVHYDQQVKQQPVKIDQTASAGIFKTVSGWQDAKYYALMDGVEPGTIIRITNPTNNKSIYAKVLGEMSGIRQNQGYDVRMSNAAASALDVGDLDKFIVRVNY